MATITAKVDGVNVTFDVKIDPGEEPKFGIFVCSSADYGLDMCDRVSPEYGFFCDKFTAEGSQKITRRYDKPGTYSAELSLYKVTTVDYTLFEIAGTKPPSKPEPEPVCTPEWVCEKGDMFSGVEYAGKNTGYQIDGCGNKRLDKSQCPVGEDGTVPDIAGECSPYDLDILSFIFCSLGLPYFILPNPETEPFPVSTLHIKKKNTY